MEAARSYTDKAFTAMSSAYRKAPSGVPMVKDWLSIAWTKAW